VRRQYTQTSLAEQFFAVILEELRCRDDPVSEMLTTLPSPPAAGPAQELTRLLRLMDKEEYLLVLLLDEFECAAANPCFDRHFFDLLRSMAQKWRMAFIVATQNDLAELWDKSLISSPLSSPFFNFFQTLTLVGFRDEEVEDYLRTVSHEAGVPFGDPEVGMIRKIGGVHPFFLNVAAYHLYQKLRRGDRELLLDRDSLWVQITQDPAIYGNFKYYWQTLSPSRRQVLAAVVRGELEQPLTPERGVDLAWLKRMGLVRESVCGSYEPFSKAFGEFVSALSQKISQA
jgi:hypothetical protein